MNWIRWHVPSVHKRRTVLIVTPDCACMSLQCDIVIRMGVKKPVLGRSCVLAARRAARGRLGVSALYPPHLYGLTQFSKGLAEGGGDRLREAKNTTWCIRQLRCRGIPRIALLASASWRVGAHNLPEGFLSIETCFWGAHCRGIYMSPLHRAPGGGSSAPPVL